MQDNAIDQLLRIKGDVGATYAVTCNDILAK